MKKNNEKHTPTGFQRGRLLKAMAVFMILEFTNSLVFPTLVWGLTGGPSTPEVQSFEPIGTNQMVDLFTGDFTYNIPLMDVGGYPINISYHGGVGMDQEASWTGLGWNINVGTINRGMRGLPDDFKGDDIVQEFNKKPEFGVGLTAALDFELFGAELKKFKVGKKEVGAKLSLGVSLGVNYSNYRGVGFTTGVTTSAAFGSADGAKTPLNAGLGFSSSAQKGLDIDANVSYSGKIGKDKLKEALPYSLGGSASFNSRQGTKTSLNASGGFAIPLESLRDENGDVVKDADGNAVLRGGNPVFTGGNLTFSNPTYFPQSPINMTNNSMTFKVKGGVTFFAGKPEGTLIGNVNWQRIENPTQTNKGYGYLYAHNHSNRSHLALQDYNRDRDQGFNYNTTTNLPVTVQTYDIYSVSGQGVGGMYRPFRSEVGQVYDGFAQNFSNAGNLGFEIAGGNAFDGGGDIVANRVETTAGPWIEGNNATAMFKFHGGEQANDDLYEPVFFKQAGEYSVDDDLDLYNQMGGSDPVQLRISERGHHHKLHPELQQYKLDAQVANITPTRNYRTSRVKRNQQISTLTVDEAKNFAVDPMLFDLSENNSISASAKGHHVGELSVTRSDGARYIYGLPAYNTLQKEVSFNITGETGNCRTSLVPYKSGVDNTTNNKRGTDHYFSATTTPAFAHSYLLTSVLAEDYIDADDTPGPSAGDYGGYTKFEYERVHADYQWRTPFKQDEANYNYGFLQDRGDNKASYIYGQKEIWYLSKIITPTMIAIFDTEAREDGLGVLGENGGKDDTKQLRKLTAIRLYTVEDYEEKGDNATPIKVAHFGYDYSLCQNIENRLPDSGEGNGKLTLTDIYFTYGSSNKGRFSPYYFYYGDEDHDKQTDNNPNYAFKANDRWGTYKPISGTSSCDFVSNNPLSNSEYPYTPQDASADQYAAAWSLSTISLPSGGEIHVDYEADDYAYVQDKRAMQMIEVVGAGSEAQPTNVVTSSGDLMTDSYVHQQYLYFKLPEPFPADPDDGSYDMQAFKEAYFMDKDGGIKNLYYRFLMVEEMEKEGEPPTKRKLEFVQGYLGQGSDQDFELNIGSGDVDNDDIGLIPSTENGETVYNYGFIKIKGTPIDDKKITLSELVNPISKATWQFNRMYLPHIAYNIPEQEGVSDDAGALKKTVQILGGANLFKQLKELAQGQNRVQRNRKIGLKFTQGKSYLRLYSPSKKKKGGGHRVKQVKMVDNWQDMGGGETMAFGSVYDYTTVENGQVISSGVAAYEPLLGGEENPWRQPIYQNVDRKLLIPDDRTFMEAPIAESLFPSASVGYSKVTVRSLVPQEVNMQGNGRTETNYYTARDFPTRVRQTKLTPEVYKDNPLQLLKIAKDHVAVTQGYSVELNNMHGQMKSTWVYPEGTDVAPISGQEYVYKTKDGWLDNTVDVLYKDGSIEQKQVGVDTDLIVDTRESKTTSQSKGAMINANGFMLAIFPAIVLPIWPTFSKEQSRFRSAVVTKVINRYALIDKVIATDLGSTVETSNHLYDAETGAVLVTKTTNQYKDDLFQTTLPAHFAYDNMELAYKNQGVEVDGTFTAGIANITGADELFINGDVLALESNEGPVKGWVMEVAGNQIKVAQKDGTPIVDASYSIKIIESGRNNMAGVPINQFVSKKEPIDRVSGHFKVDNSIGILSASAMEYNDKWQMKEGSTETNCEDMIVGATLIDLMGVLAKQDNLDSENVLVPISDLGDEYKLDGIIFDEAQPDPPSEEENYYTEFFPDHMGPYTTFPWEKFESISYTDAKYAGEVVELDDGNTESYVLCGRLEFKDSQNADVISKLFTIYLCDNEGRRVRLVHEAEQNYLKNIISICNLTKIDEPTGEGTCPILTGNALEYNLSLKGTLTSLVGSTAKTHSVRIDFPRAFVPIGHAEGCFISKSCGLEPLPPSEQQCGAVAGDIVNPFQEGIWGQFRPQKSWAYLTNRTGDKVNQDLRNDGEFTSYNNFWKLNAQNEWVKDENNWTWTQEVTMYHPEGIEIENKNALDIYSAEKLGYGDRFVIAVGANTEYENLWYSGFEDFGYSYNGTCDPIYVGPTAIAGLVEDEESHTGFHSLKIPANHPDALLATNIDYVTNSPLPNFPYQVEQEDLFKRFEIHTRSKEQKFWVSYWFRAQSWQDGLTPSTAMMAAADPVSVTSTVNGFSVSNEQYIANGEGWAMVRKLFTIPANETGELKLQPVNTETTYLDDLRLFPYLGTMKSYVYHPENLRLIAELDEHNFGKLYEYDEEGKLIRVKKETERGVVTLSENRDHTPKKGASN